MSGRNCGLNLLLDYGHQGQQGRHTRRTGLTSLRLLGSEMAINAPNVVQPM